LDRDLAIAIRHIPLTQADSDKVYGWYHWEEAQEIARNRQKLDNPEKEKERVARLKELESTGKTTPEEFEQAVKSTPTVFYVNLLHDIQESQQEYSQLREVMKAKFGLDDTPKMENTPKLLETCYHFIQKTLEDKGPLEIEPPEETIVIEPEKDDADDHGRFVDGQQGSHTLAASDSLTPKNRADALRRLEAVAVFFRSTEPHSPVPALVERAIKYEKMPLETLLQQVIPDAKVLKTVRESLGFEEAVSPGDAE
jgi:type VI secretion system protein ImpA